MTQDRSRLLGRAIIGWAALQMLLAPRALRGAPWWLALPATLIAGALSLLFAWAGYTLVTMDWDHPADYPPSAAPEAPDARPQATVSAEPVSGVPSHGAGAPASPASPATSTPPGAPPPTFV